MWRLIKNLDWVLLIVTLFLTVLSIVLIYSTIFKEGGGISNNTIFIRHLVFIGIGLILMSFLCFLDYTIFKKYNLIFYIINIILLVFVLKFGSASFGAKRWLDFGFFQFQPSELCKFFLILILANFFSTNFDKFEQFRYILISFLIMAIPTGLVYLQPDLGTAIIFFVIWLVMFLSVKTTIKNYLILTGLIIISLPIIWIWGLHDYQKMRLLTFFNPLLDPQGAGYNILQSMIAIGSGQIFGRGFGQGIQSHLNFLPVVHSDFIFALLAEEWGFIGAIVILVAFLILITRGLRAVYLAKDNFGIFLALGIITLFSFQIILNIGMNVGLMPIAGVPLPLVSYGGTATIINFVLIGILQSIILRHKKIIF